MQKDSLGVVLLCVAAVVVSGCTVRMYRVTKDRTDQDLTLGNRGYISGQPQQAPAERKKTRDLNVVEIEWGAPKIKDFEAESTTRVDYTSSTEEREYGNRGYIYRSVVPEEIEPQTRRETVKEAVQEYIVQKGDTLQKISQKLYGTSKKWYKIYKLNAATLKSPDKVYPGQRLIVPAPESQRSGENLK